MPQFTSFHTAEKYIKELEEKLQHAEELIRKLEEEIKTKKYLELLNPRFCIY